MTYNVCILEGRNGYPMTQHIFSFHNFYDLMECIEDESVDFEDRNVDNCRMFEIPPLVLRQLRNIGHCNMLNWRLGETREDEGEQILDIVGLTDDEYEQEMGDMW